jgi:hypothetical protein
MCPTSFFYRLIANYGQITTPMTKSNLIVLTILIYKSHAHLTPYLQKWIHFHHFYLPCTHLPSAYQVQKVIKEGSFRFTGNSLNRPYSLHLQRAMRANTAEKWFQRRVQKYGPISKLSLFGKPTVFIYGQAQNKFVFTSDSITLAKAKHKLWRGFWGINVNNEKQFSVLICLPFLLHRICIYTCTGVLFKDGKLRIEIYKSLS